MSFPVVSLSIVSHGQRGLVGALLQDIQQYCLQHQLEILLTLNIEETLPEGCDHPGYSLQVIRNPTPLGFGSNHNQAFARAQGDFFCVLNPDIRLAGDPFVGLLQTLRMLPLGVVAPRVVNPHGDTEASARRFPTPMTIVRKAFGWRAELDYPLHEALIYPDWVGGMFMLFPRASYARLAGFDARYFLYYEDVDLCARSWLAGMPVALNSMVSVTHDARRSSHRKLAYLRWHLQSMLRFFCSKVFLRAIRLRRGGRVSHA